MIEYWFLANCEIDFQQNATRTTYGNSNLSSSENHHFVVDNMQFEDHDESNNITYLNIGVLMASHLGEFAFENYD